MLYSMSSDVNSNPLNNMSCVFALQSYNESPGSINFVDVSKGHSEPHPITRVGLVNHSADITSDYMNSGSSIFFPDRTGVLVVPGSEDFNFYDEDFTIYWHHYPYGLGDNDNFMPISFIQDDKNYWQLRCESYYGYYRFILVHEGNTYINTYYDWENRRLDNSQWYYGFICRYGDTLRFGLGYVRNDAGGLYFSKTVTLSYFPRFVPEKSKLVIGGWMNADGTVNTGWSMKGAMNSIAVFRGNVMSQGYSQLISSKL